ncbi:hypothetical protein E0493_03480 [Roseomonas sp. M0104]|uniref:DUF1328 domain-containing protein n=1 Tax=Teichococcus coralli TaxID=2545983 RepID=A0A845B8K2_9PROT|nr:hypothetical protein [Pseudoroseomonas coralli]MXP62414.1 hypothetical protein [Pseudoroseomonas coralli]
MSPTRVFFVIFSGLIALVGLLGAGTSVEGPFTLFCLSLFLFGVLFALFLVKRSFDEAETAPRA